MVRVDSLWSGWIDDDPVCHGQSGLAVFRADAWVSVQARPIYTDPLKGVMTPPVLVDLTGDGTVDIVINPFNSTVLAIDGRTYSVLWNRSFPLSESYRSVLVCVCVCVCVFVCLCVFVCVC